jgi:hypothetical protein
MQDSESNSSGLASQRSAHEDWKAGNHWSPLRSTMVLSDCSTLQETKRLMGRRLNGQGAERKQHVWGWYNSLAEIMSGQEGMIYHMRTNKEVITSFFECVQDASLAMSKWRHICALLRLVRQTSDACQPMLSSFGGRPDDVSTCMKISCSTFAEPIAMEGGYVRTACETSAQALARGCITSLPTSLTPNKPPSQRGRRMDVMDVIVSANEARTLTSQSPCPWYAS